MVKSAIKNGTSFLFTSQKTIISAAGVISVAYACSAVLSFIRTRILSAHFGDSTELGVFFVADRIPTLIFTILVVGTVSAVFVPIFTSAMKKNEEDAWRVSSTVINFSLLVFLALGVITFVFSREIMALLSASSFSSEDIELGANLMRIMISAQIVLIFSSFVTSILQSFKYFIIPALAPIFYNIGMIIGVVFLTPIIGIYGAAYGVAIGAFLHLCIQLPLLFRANYKHTWSLDLKDPAVREIFRLAPPRILATAANQISATVHTTLAVLVSTTSVVVFKFADQLQSFPVTLFGASIALAALPTLSHETDDTTYEKFKETFVTSLHQMLFLVIPAAIVLLVLRVPVVRLVYGTARFSWEATLATSYAVAFFSLSIFSQSAVYLITRAFYALHDTKTPLKVMLLTIPLDVALSFYFVKVLGFGVWAIAFSYSISSILDFVILLYLVSKKVGGFNLEGLVQPFVKISYAALFMGISLYLPMKLLEQYIFDTTRTLPLLFLTLTVCAFGFLSYLLFTKIFSVKEVELLYRVIGKLGFKTSDTTPIAESSQTMQAP